MESLEQIRTAAGTDEIEIVTVDLVEQQPVWLDTAVAVLPPLACERMISVTYRKRSAFAQKQDQLTKLCHVLAALFCELYIASKLRAADEVSHSVRCPGL
jgi:hypothetical protein